VLDEMVQRDTSDVDALVGRAVVLSRAKGLRAALQSLSGDLEGGAGSATYFAARGTIRVALRDFAGAISDLRKAVRLKPDSPQTRNALGIAELLSGRADTGERRFREAMRIAPLYDEPFLNLLRVLMHEARHEEVLENVSRRYPSPRDVPARVARIAVQAALGLERWTLAHEWSELAEPKTEGEEPRARLLNDWGVALARMGRHSDAARRFERSFEEWSSELALVNRAKALLDAGDVADAIEWILRAGEAVPVQGTERAMVLAVALSRAHRHLEAIEIYEHLIATGKAEPVAYANLIAALTDHGIDPAKAIDVGRDALDRFPRYAAIINNLAYAYLMSDRVVEAAALLESESIVQSDSDAVCLTATRGLLALKEGDLSRGHSLYDEALKLTQSGDLRAVVKAKRDLEMARALLRVNGRTDATLDLLHRAAAAGEAAYPYSAHAQWELRRLK